MVSITIPAHIKNQYLSNSSTEIPDETEAGLCLPGAQSPRAGLGTSLGSRLGGAEKHVGFLWDDLNMVDL